MTTTQTTTNDATVRRRQNLVLAFVALALVGFSGYVVGEKTSVRTHTGTAYVGDHVFSVEVDGWTYGARQSVTWIDEAGAFHEGGWPDCLSAVATTTPVTFGEAEVSVPDHAGYRQVLWVDCR